MAETVSVRVPTALRGHVGEQASVDVGGGTVREVLDNLVAQHPGLRGRLLDDRGEVNKYVNIFVNDEDVRFLENLGTTLKAGDTVTLVPSIAGG
jgi:molybdopterin synthase sulfur carrier subunit